MVYLITYDLNKKGQNYYALYEAIKTFGEYIHPLDSTWLIETNSSTDTVYNFLRQYIDGNDRLFIVKVVDYWGYMDNEFWPWIKGRVG